MALYYMSLPLGIVLGYILDVLFLTTDTWEYGFLFKGVLLLVPICLTFLLIPDRYFKTPTSREETQDHHQQFKQSNLYNSATLVNIRNTCKTDVIR